MRYWIQRLAMVIALLLAVSMLTFGAMNLLGDPLFNILGPVAADVDNPESLKKINAAKAEYHLDKPLPERYVRWLGSYVQGDFGQSFAQAGFPVRDIVAERLPRSLLLMGMAQFLALLFAIPWGVFTAARANKVSDRVSTVGSFLLIGLPNFALAVILYYVFALKLDDVILWATGREEIFGFDGFPLRYDDDTIGSRLFSLILPAMTLALPGAAVYQRLLRTDMITTLQEDFILMARAKGVSKMRVLFRHALRPSMVSVLTVFGINAGALIGGALIVETFFGIPGMGSGIVEAILREDFPVVLAFVMVITVGFVVLNLLVDILYGFLDPRVRS